MTNPTERPEEPRYEVGDKIADVNGKEYRAYAERTEACPHEDIQVVTSIDQETMTLDDLTVICKTCECWTSPLSDEVVLGPWEKP